MFDGYKWYWRVPIKLLIAGLTLLIVCFPYPRVLLRHISHMLAPSMLIEPEAPLLAPLLEEVEPQLRDVPPGKEALKIVERYVYKKLPYDWDWRIWGTADYLPSVGEALTMGREDCDGRAVVAASILAHFGYEPELVTDFTHVWVKTNKGETMGPGKQSAVTVKPGKTEVRLGAVLPQIAKSLPYGVAVFPLAREVIVLLVVWGLLLSRRVGIGWAGVALAAMFAGLMLLRVGGADHQHPRALIELAGGVLLLMGAGLTWVGHARTTCHAMPTKPRTSSR